MSTDYPNESNPVKLVKNDCGKHWSHKGGPCGKCAYHADFVHRNQKHLQYSGTPWIAVLQPNDFDSIQEQAIRNARR